jgi:transposase
VIPPLRFFPAFAPARPFIRAQRALAAAAIFARAAVDIRRLPARRGTIDAPPASPTKALSRLSNASIWRRIDKACSKFRVDESIGDSDRLKFR